MSALDAQIVIAKAQYQQAQKDAQDTYQKALAFHKSMFNKKRPHTEKNLDIWDRAIKFIRQHKRQQLTFLQC